MAKKTAISDLIPFPHQMSGHEQGLAAIRFATKQRLKPGTPARIQTESWFIEQEHRRVGQEE